jgi:tRNA-modifying protein YgfZ
VTPSLEADYRALTEVASVADLSDRTLVELTGADRAKFLHNLCSNDILRLTPGGGCEAFLLNVKGKVAAHLFVYCSLDSLILDSSPGQGEKIIAHLDRYIIRENVDLHDRTPKVGQLLVDGPQAAALLEELGAAALPELLSHAAATLGGKAALVRRSGLTGADAFTVVCSREHKESLAQTLMDAGAAWRPAAAVEAARIEAGVPLYGVDITEDNLPQEVDRNDRAISFTKGCYLGQETVARIDALGHVNRTLVGLRFAPLAAPAPGKEIKSTDTIVGRVTSVAYSHRWGCAVGLGYVRQGHNVAGTRLTSSDCGVEVVPLPMR